MKKNTSLAIYFMMSLIVITACGQDDGQGEAGDELSTEPIEVEVLIDDEGEPGQEIELVALVTHGGEPVEDASEVIFEVWRQGQKERSDMLEYEHHEEGVYSVSYLFEEAGIYHVQPHVTARNMHRMPVHDIAIGEVDDNNVQEEHDIDHEPFEGDIDGEDSSLDVTFQEVDDMIAGQEVELQWTIEREGEPFTNARVLLEIRQNEDDEEEWVELTAEDNGTYAGTHTFEREGQHTIIVHIEDDTLHEHVEETIEVQ